MHSLRSLLFLVSREAAIRLAQLELERRDIAPRFAVARDKFTFADSEYRRKVLELAGIPHAYWHGSEVRIIDSEGSVKILFGGGRGHLPSCLVMDSSGSVHYEYE